MFGFLKHPVHLINICSNFYNFHIYLLFILNVHKNIFKLPTDEPDKL